MGWTETSRRGLSTKEFLRKEFEYESDRVRYSSERCGSPRNRVDSVTNLDIDEAITRRFGLEAEDIPVVELSQWGYGGENVTALTGDVTKRRTVATFHSPPSGRVWLFGGIFWKATYSSS